MKKCSNCGKNEVSFYYTANVNGKVTKYELCTECAEKLGLLESTENMFAKSRRMMGRMFSDPFESFFGRDLFDDFALESPLFAALPGFASPQKQEEKQEQPQVDADPELVRRREINALRNQMNDAVKAENFEKAAELRDKIRELEKNE